MQPSDSNLPVWMMMMMMAIESMDQRPLLIIAQAERQSDTIIGHAIPAIISKESKLLAPLIPSLVRAWKLPGLLT